MLSELYYAHGFPVNDLFVLDMYRHGKMNWMIDKLFRFVLAVMPVLIGVYAKDHIKQKQAAKNRLEMSFL